MTDIGDRDHREDRHHRDRDRDKERERHWGRDRDRVIGNLIMIGLNRNMRGIDMVRGRRTMITLNQRMIVGGMNSLSKGISIQTKTKTLSLMSVIEVGANMIIWMSKMTMTVMTNIMTVVMTNMIEWRMMITNMSMQHRSHVKGRENKRCGA
uniref:Uncharacterized protein n=1 Tax=Fagus sylvatica TaxID=28930 RepID=A0A2N9HH45_FAGSY